MRLLIWGAGAIGGTIGAWLAHAGHDITLVDQNEAHIRAIQANGINITGTVDEFRVALPAYTPSELTGTFEHILLCVKAHHTESALDSVVPLLAVASCPYNRNKFMDESRTQQCCVPTVHRLFSFFSPLFLRAFALSL